MTGILQVRDDVRPTNVAIVDSDEANLEVIERDLVGFGFNASSFRCTEDLLTAPTPFDFQQYVIELDLPGIGGLALIKTLRRRTTAGVLVLTTDPSPETFVDAMEAGADMLLLKPADSRQVIAALRAIGRRAQGQSDSAGTWLLDLHMQTLRTPKGAVVDLSSTDCVVMQCLAQANEQPVSKNDLNRHIGRTPTDEFDNGLHATIYRLRKKIERTCGEVAPIHTVAGVGYVFKGPVKIS